MQGMSYTPEEVAKILKVTRFTVYEMIKRGELQAYRIGRKMRIEEQDLEEYKRRSKGASATNNIETSAAVSFQKMSPANYVSGGYADNSNQVQQMSGFIICGQDVVLDVLTRHLDNRMPGISILRNYVGSFTGLLAMYHGKANIATGHLWAGDLDEYNVPFVKRLLPGIDTVVVNLVYRMAGLYVQKGNPKKIKGWQDLTMSGVRFVNREKGCGARVLVDEKLKINGIDVRQIAGYDYEEMSHLAVASAVARDDADVGVGIEKAAMQVSGVDFIPLQKERYDMVVRKSDLEKPHFIEMLDVLRSPSFKKEIVGMGHYDVTNMGELIYK